MRGRNIFLIFFGVAMLVAGFFVLAGTREVEAATKSFTKIFYYREGENARESFFTHWQSIDVLAPQSYSIDGTGMLMGSVNPNVLSSAKAHGIKVMPLVTNKMFDEKIAENILNDQVMQDLVIKKLVTEGEAQGFWGWQIDFEGMDAPYRDKYSAFIKKAGEAMKEYNLVLSVAVVAQISENPGDYPNNLWTKVIGAYDYKALGSSVDFISVMSYDDPGSKGPVARYAWLKQVLAYSLKNIPASKLSLGIPFYYWKWSDTSGKLMEIGGNAGIQNVLKNRNPTFGYSTVFQAAFMKYKIDKKPYTLWYENGTSVGKKIDLVKQYKLHGFSAWTLGLEVPSVYSVI